MGYIFGGLGAVILLLGIALKIQDTRLDNARQDLAQAKTTIQLAHDANQSNLETIAQCQAVNQQNQSQRDNALERAQAAEIRVIELISTQVKVKPYEPVTNECRKLTDVLPADYISWLCSSGANCQN